MASNLRSWVVAARPKTLTAAVIPVLVGTSLAVSDHATVNWLFFILPLLGAILIQIGTNLVNDAIDFRKGTDTAERLGPLRVTQAGLLTHQRVMAGAWICFGVAIVVGIPIVLRGGTAFIVIGLASILAAYLYTGGPYPLAYHGLGDVFVIVFFGLIAVGGTYYLQTLAYSFGAIVGGLSMGFLATVLLAVNNLRDHQGDALSGKRTLAVRFGVRGAQAEIAILSIAPFAMSALWLLKGQWLAFVLPIVALPLALRVIRSSQIDQGRSLNRTLGTAAALHAAYGLMFSIGLLIPT
ncbi:MAG: 1,4-dihydroxy-2-naphthoate polyprenyltransferase [Acidobacteriota bacterium]